MARESIDRMILMIIPDSGSLYGSRSRTAITREGEGAMICIRPSRNET